YINNNDMMWSSGQVIQLALVFSVPIVSFFGMFSYPFCFSGVTAYTSSTNRLLEACTSPPRVKQHPESEVGEDIPASQNDLPWYFIISPAIFFVRKVKVVLILAGAVGAGLGLMFLLQWYHGNRATGKASS